MRLPDTSRHPNDRRSYASFRLRAVTVLGITLLLVAVYLVTFAAVGGHPGWRDAVPVVAGLATFWALHELRVMSPSSDRRWVYWAEVFRDSVAAAAVFMATFMILGIPFR